MALPVLKRRLKIERALNSVGFMDPKGDKATHEENNAKWLKALKPFLVDKGTAYAISGDEDFCSDGCFDAKESGYRFVDEARFKLFGCVHHSHHLQCILTSLSFFSQRLTACTLHGKPQSFWRSYE